MTEAERKRLARIVEKERDPPLTKWERIHVYLHFLSRPGRRPHKADIKNGGR